MSSKNNDEKFAVHSESDNTEIMINVKPEEVIELFQSFLSSY